MHHSTLIELDFMRSVPTNDLPMMRFATSLDFDEDAGLFVLGTSKGELCVVDFAARLPHRHELLGHLPSQDKLDAFQELDKVSSNYAVKFRI